MEQRLAYGTPRIAAAVELLVSVLRFVHITAAVAWVGGVFFFLAVLDPLLKRVGPEEAGRLGRHLALRTRMSLFFPVSAILAVGGGLALFGVMEAHRMYPFSTAQGIVFQVGAIAGLVAIIPGIASGLQSARMKHEAAAFEAKPNATLGKAMGARAALLSRLTKVTGGLMVVALFGMGTFRYWA